MLLKIALRNVRRQFGGYFIYFVTVALTVSLLFSLNSMIFSQTVYEISLYFKEQVMTVSAFLSVVLSFVSAIVLGYGSAFLLRRRKKEFGLYLTLGMSRRNILTIFSVELFMTFVFSLFAGLGLGSIVYQIIVAGIFKFLMVEFTWGDYSVPGLILTVIMVALIFLLSSLVSLIYLRRVTISKLLQGQKISEKTVRHPSIWLKVVIVFAVTLVISLILIVSIADDPSISNYTALLVGGAAVAFISIIMVYVGAMKCAIFYLLKNKNFSARGTRTFTLRQLSGRLSADSVIFGLIAMLLSVVITGGDIFLTAVGAQVYSTNLSNPYTVSIIMPHDASGELTQGMDEWVQPFGETEELRRYSVYELTDSQLNTSVGVSYNSDCVMRESDYLALAEMTGQRAAPVGDGIAVLCNYFSVAEFERVKAYNFEGFELTFGDYSLPVAYVSDIRSALAVDAMHGLIAVVPDAVVNAAERQGGVFQNAVDYLVVNYKDGEFDEEGFRQFFEEKCREDKYIDALESAHGFVSNHYFYVSVGGSFNSSLMQMAAPWLIIVFFVSVVFALLSMAVLGLKTLASVAEDRGRYRLLFFAGATEKEALLSLTLQLVLYFFLPFAVPLLVNIPVSFICMAISGMFGGYMPNIQVVGYAALFSAALIVIYGLYCAVACLVSRRDIKKTLRSVG